MTQFQFPDTFYWGAATASYQVEGWNENTDWAKAAKAGKVPIAGRLADQYHRYAEDFAIAKELGHNAHRFSIEWARIEPREGEWDEKEIEHYRHVLQELQQQDLEPFITCWHFTLPIWLAEQGGFENPQTVEYFARYCAKLVEEFGDYCTHFSTINEPNVYATHGYLYGAWPPFKRARIAWKKLGKEDGTSERTGATARFRHLFTYLKVTRLLADAHKAAYQAIKTVNPQVQVSIVKHVHYFEGDSRFYNKLLARLMTYLQSLQFMNRISQELDEIGLNYYRDTKFGDTKNYLQTDMGWNAYPSGIFGVLLVLKKYRKPIYISEAGLADEDDDLRAQYIALQIEGVARAMQVGVDVRGHLYWSLLDNYEWALGTTKRFGLVAIDYNTLERTIRPSAFRYKETIEENAITLVERTDR